MNTDNLQAQRDASQIRAAHTLTYSAEKQGRLDHYLVSSFPDHSRTYLRGLIDKNHVLVNQKGVSKSGAVLKIGDTVSIEFPTAEPSHLVAHKVDFEVIDMQPDFIIINKPAGLTVHPAPSNLGDITLAHGLLHRFEELVEFNDDERPGIVHRLDRDTSGVMIVARNERGKSKIGTMFHDRLIKKTYCAVVHGHPAEREGTIDFPIGRDRVYRHKMSHRGLKERVATTFYAVRSYHENFTVIDCFPVTGRTHQIRVHCKAIGHSIFGDELYGETSKLIKRQALHAHKLAFEYDGKAFEYSVPLPDDMVRLIATSPELPAEIAE